MKKPLKKKPKLRKYGIGGQNEPVISLADQQAIDAQERANMNFSSGQPSNQQYAQYAGATMAGMGAYNASQMQNSELPTEQRQGKAINAGVDATAGSLTPWYAMAKGASNMGKNAIAHETTTDPVTGETMEIGKTRTGNAWRDTFTPLHETVINSASEGNWGDAALQVFTGGVNNTLDNYFNGTDRKKFDAMKARETAANQPAVVDTKDYRQDAAWQRVNGYNGNQGEFMKYGGMLPPYAQYPMGGMPVNPNAELELQENTMNQNGEFTQYDGPSHEQGGIPTELDPAEMVFSDKLKMGKKTFADLNKANNTSKQDKVLSDPKADRTSKTTAQLIADIKLRKSKELFAAQEQLKQDKVAKYAERMGVKLPVAGKPTMRHGGLKRYWAGGEGDDFPTNIVNPLVAADPNGDPNAFVDNTELINATNDLGASSFSGRNIPMTTETARSYNPGYKQSGPSNEELAAYNADLVRLGDKNRPTMRSSSPEVEDSDYNSMRTRNIMEGVSNGVFQNAGNFYDLYKSGFGKKYDKEDFGRVNPSFVKPRTIDATESLRDADRESAASRASLRGAVGGNAGAYMANLAANQTANTLNKARIREGVANANTGILNQADNTNAGIRNNAELTNLNLKNQARMAEQQNKARSEDMAAHAVRDMGSKFASSYKDYKSGEMDEKRMTLINQYFPNYKYNPDTFEMYFNASQSASKTKKKSKSKPTAKSGVGYTAAG